MLCYSHVLEQRAQALVPELLSLILKHWKYTDVRQTLEVLVHFIEDS